MPCARPVYIAALAAAFALALTACSDEGGASPNVDAAGTDGTADASDIVDASETSGFDVPQDDGPTPTDLGSVPDADLVITPGEDSDGDGISDDDEIDIVGTDPHNADTDGDNLIDGVELEFGSNPLVADSDGDGLDDDGEWLAGTRPDLADTDADGFSDGQEIDQGTDPLDPFSYIHTVGEWTDARARADGAYGTGWDLNLILPNASFLDQLDQPFDLWQLYGNVVLLDFSALWCQPCRELAEGAQELWEAYRDEGFMIVHVITETALAGEPAVLSSQVAWADEFDLTFPVVRDETGEVYSTFVTEGVYTGALPFTVLLDRDMRIDNAFGAGQEDQMEARIQLLIAGDVPPYPPDAPEASPAVEGTETDLCDEDGDGVKSFACGGGDCHDHTPLAGPESDELCGFIDWNCDGDVDDGAADAAPLYFDQDLDGYGDPALELLSCAPSLWSYAGNGEDCDDEDASLNPDTVWYLDADEDGYGNPAITLAGCEPPEGYVDNGQDTDDGDDTSLGCWAKVTVGRDHSCGLKKDGTIDCWGNNSDGELLYPAGSDFVDIDSGYQHTCAQKGDGTITCWGSASGGTTSPPAGVTFLSYTCGLGACCGITDAETNNALCWGKNDDGQTDVPEGTYTAASIGGGRHACAVTDAQDIVCWGKTQGFQGGPSPTVVVPGTYAKVSAAHYFTCGLSPDGEPTCWGGNKYGQGSPPPGPYLSLLGGTVHACGIKSDQTLACWGSDSFGRTDSPPGEFVQLDVNQLHSCAVGADGLIKCWGFGDEGQTTVPACNP